MENFLLSQTPTVIYVDDILEQDIIRMLGEKYSKKGKDDILFVFFIRMFIVNCYPNFNNIEYISTDNISSFLHKELKLDDVFLFESTKIQRGGYAAGNCTNNIVDTWRWEYLNQFHSIKGIFLNDSKHNTISIIKLLISKYLMETERILKKYPKKTPLLAEKAISIMFEILEKDFDIKIKETAQNPLISYKMFSDKIDNVKYYTECKELFNEKHSYDLEIDVETYIENNYKHIFPFLSHIKRQYIVKDNIIDILGFDNDNNVYIFEIKNTSKPKDLIFQLKNYKHQISNMIKDTNINIVSVTPALNEDYIRELKNINAKIYFFIKKKGEYNFIEYK